MKKLQTIFKKGSTTYYYSSLFFPANLRNSVTTLYAFVRTADDYVDAIPQQESEFNNFKKATSDALNGISTEHNIITPFIALLKEHTILKEWVTAFLNSMSADLHKKIYATYEELEEYMYGSAEVVGLMMARLMKLPEQSYNAARTQGKAMQLLNFIRDVKEDLELGRQYIPESDLRQVGVKKLSPSDINIEKLITYEINRYFLLQKKAEEGYKYIPRDYLIPIKTAADLYKWTAKTILKDPRIIFRKKIKPTPLYVFWVILKNRLTI